MSHSYVCTTCRLQHIIRKASQISYRQRQWLSQTARARQNPTGDALARHQRNDFARLKTREQSNENFPDGQARGRYSGRPLAPQELLKQLNHSVERDEIPNHVVPNARGHSPRQKAPRQRPETIDREAIPPTKAKAVKGPIEPVLWKLTQRFFDVSRIYEGEKPDDLAAIEILRQISLCPKRDDFYYSESFHRKCFFLMRRICNRWDRQFQGELSAQDGPTPVEALTTITACTSEVPGIYSSTLWQLTTAGVRLYSRREANSENPLRRCVDELMASWNLTMRIKLSPDSMVNLSPDATRDWSFLPSQALIAEKLQQRMEGADKGALTSLIYALNMFLPEDKSQSARAAKLDQEHAKLYDYASAAIVTLDLLQQMESESGHPSSMKSYEPWMSVIDHISRGVAEYKAPPALAQKADMGTSANYYRDVVSRLISPGNDGDGAIEPERITVSQGKEVLKSDSVAEDVQSPLPNGLSSAVNVSTPTLQFADICSKDLGRALEQQDVASAHRIYKTIKEFVTRRAGTVLPQELYETLLYTFLSLRSPNPTISIWNDMVQAGHRPTVKTYTIMMRGSQDIRDQGTAMEKFWQRMRQSGLQPDHNAWTTRIFGMFKTRLPADVPLKALSEMGQEWEAAAQKALAKSTSPKGKHKDKSIGDIPMSELLEKFAGDVNGVPKPDVTIMNSAISGLSASADHLIPRVLSWGRMYGIKPDLTAYNVLINISMRKGLPNEALKLLRRMGTEGIEPDSSTWTVLLSAMFEGDSLENLTEEEVEQRVLGFVKSIDNMPGPGLDEKGYALIVDRLLKRYDNAFAAQKILEQMAAKGMKPNTALYTILMTSYFQKSPPDFAAVEALSAHILSGNDGYGVGLDAMFYDRMIEFYAQHHNAIGTQPMLKSLERMEAQGKRPSWKALEFAARALVEAGQKNRLTQIVQRAAMERGSPGERQNFGEREFWRFLESVGIRKDDYHRNGMRQLT